MNTQIALEHQAIAAAKAGDWRQAIELNQTILASNSNQVGALNRLGVAHIQLGEIKAAKSTFEQVLKLDRSNAIAKKHLARLKTNQTSTAGFSQVYFIEEPGKTKIVELHRLAGKLVLEKLHVGQVCSLKLKNRYVSVESQDIYIGALPEDLSFRLSKLISTGNQYECFVHAVTINSCSVYIRELFRDQRNEYTHSFPITKNAVAPLNDIDEEFLIDDFPVDMGGTETSEELDSDDKSFPHEDTLEEERR